MSHVDYYRHKGLEQEIREDYAEANRQRQWKE